MMQPCKRFKWWRAIGVADPANCSSSNEELKRSALKQNRRFTSPDPEHWALMRRLDRFQAGNAVVAADTNGRCWSHLRPFQSIAQLRCRGQNTTSALSQLFLPAPRLAPLRHGASACRAQLSAGNAAAQISTSVGVMPDSAAVSQAGSIKTFDVVHLGNLCLDIIVPVDELPSADTGADKSWSVPVTYACIQAPLYPRMFKFVRYLHMGQGCAVGGTHGTAATRAGMGGEPHHPQSKPLMLFICTTVCLSTPALLKCSGMLLYCTGGMLCMLHATC
jgi:hypothetical protein